MAHAIGAAFDPLMESSAARPRVLVNARAQMSKRQRCENDRGNIERNGRDPHLAEEDPYRDDQKKGEVALLEKRAPAH